MSSAHDRVRSLRQRYATEAALACCMSTVQLPKLADRCPERAHDLDAAAAWLPRQRFRLSLPYEAAKANLVCRERCFECIPARIFLHGEHCVSAALVGAQVRARVQKTSVSLRESS